MITVIYNGVDITKSVTVKRCIHDMFAGDRSDYLHVRFSDIHNQWDAWSPQKGDMIRIDCETISTGTMFVTDAIRKNSLFDIWAQAAPPSGFDPQDKAWQMVRLFQIAEEIAKRHGLTLKTYGVTDHLYSYILQSQQGDFAFLQQRARLEGCAMLIYDDCLILYNERYMEAMPPSETLTIGIGADYEYSDRSMDLYGSCVVASGQYSGQYSAVNGSSRIYRPENLGNVGSKAEAMRFAQNLLRSANKGCCSGSIHTQILAGYAPASTVILSNSKAPTWDGAVFIDHVRNDYCKDRSKVFFRRLLEGY